MADWWLVLDDINSTFGSILYFTENKNKNRMRSWSSGSLSREWRAWFSPTTWEPVWVGD